MKRFFKIVSILLITLLIASCGQNVVRDDPAPAPTAPEASAEGETAANDDTPANDETAPVEVRESIVLNILDNRVDAPTSSLEDEIGRMIYEELQIELLMIPFTESHFERALMMLAAQDWGNLDIVQTALDHITVSHIEAGVLVNLDEHRHLMPDFFSYHADSIPFWRLLDVENGNLYVWQAGPDQIQMTNPPLDIVTRIDVMEALGWPELDTTDDYIAFLREALEMFPESNGQRSIGMSFFFGDPIGPLISTYLPRHSGFQHFYKTTGFVDVDNDEIIPLITHPYARATAEFFNALWRYGIMDREAWTDSFGEVHAKAEAGVSLSIFFQNWVIHAANEAADARGTPDAHYIVTPIRLQIAADEGRNVRYEIYNMARPDETKGILRQSPHVERIAELINFMSNEEMTRRLGWGIEGVHYTVEGGQLVATPYLFEMVNSPDSHAYFRSLGMHMGYSVLFPVRYLGLLPNGQAAAFGRDPDFNMARITPAQQRFLDAHGYENLLSPWRDNPNFEFIPFDITRYVSASILDPNSEEGRIAARITDYINQQMPIVITSNTIEEFNSNFDDMVQRVLDMGLDQVIALYNEQLQDIDARLEELARR